MTKHFSRRHPMRLRMLSAPQRFREGLPRENLITIGLLSCRRRDHLGGEQVDFNRSQLFSPSILSASEFERNVLTFLLNKILNSGWSKDYGFQVSMSGPHFQTAIDKARLKERVTPACRQGFSREKSFSTGPLSFSSPARRATLTSSIYWLLFSYFSLLFDNQIDSNDRQVLERSPESGKFNI